MVNEIVTWTKEAKKKLLLFKVDFAKAYDCVLDFLESETNGVRGKVEKLDKGLSSVCSSLGAY